MRALSITVASTVPGASSIASLAFSTVLSHLNEVKSTVCSAGQLGNIYIESKFFASQLKHFVVVIVSHHVHPSTDVRAVWAMSD